jgi:hypothetical protein
METLNKKKENRQQLMRIALFTILLLIFIYSLIKKNHIITFYILKGVIINATIIFLLNLYNFEEKKIFSSNSFLLIATLTLNIVYDLLHQRYFEKLIKKINIKKINIK